MFNWLKKHKILVCVLSFIIILGVPLAIHILFKINSGIPFFEAEWTAGDALGYYGSILSFIGTVILGVLALYQNRIIKEESDKREELMERQERERNMPKFSVRGQSSRGNCAYLGISINNVSENIATNIKIYDAKIISPKQEIIWKIKKELFFEIIMPINHIIAEFDNISIQDDESQYLIWMQCEDKYNEVHRYKISGIYYAKDHYPQFEIEEITG